MKSRFPAVRTVGCGGHYFLRQHPFFLGHVDLCAAPAMSSAGILVNRWGTPEDIARAALFLASDESGFINGQVIGVDGGASIRFRWMRWLKAGVGCA